MMNYTVLMSAGVQYAVIFVLVLLVVGIVTLVVIKEQKRKANARARAEERRRLREEALRKARSGQLDAFANLTTVTSPIPVQTPESVKEMSQSQWIQRVESRKDNLEALMQVNTAAENVQQNPLQAAEVPVLPVPKLMGEEDAPEEVKQEEKPAAPVVEEKSIVNFRALTDQLDAEDKEDDSIVPSTVPMPVQAPAAEVKKEAIPTEAVPAAEEAIPVAEEEPVRKETVTAKAEEPVREETGEPAFVATTVIPVIPQTIIEEDEIDCTPKFRTGEEKTEEESAFKPYKAEYEELAMQYEAMPRGQEAPAAVPAENAAQKVVAEVVAPQPTLTETISLAAPEPQVQNEEFVTVPKAEEIPAPAMPLPSFFAEPEKEMPEPVAAPEKTQAFNFTLPEDEPLQQGGTMVFERPVEQPENDMTDAAAPAEGIDARQQRMAEKAKFAAALAGEIDIEEIDPEAARMNEPEEPVSLLDDDDEEDEGAPQGGKAARIFLWIVAVLLLLICVGAVIYLFFGSSLKGLMSGNGKTKTVAATEMKENEAGNVNRVIILPGTVVPEAAQNEETVEEAEVFEEEEEVIPEPEPVVYTTFVEEPHFVPSTDPINWGITMTFASNDEIVDTYLRDEVITFGAAEEYSQVAGVTTFRGNNYRNDAAYGYANLVDVEFNGADWIRLNGGLDDSDGDTWSGCGWTGQPLIVQWDPAVRRVMTSLYEEKQEKDGFTEVIYATMDGYIYFFDLEDGSYSRDPLFVGMTFKGAGAIDPRGIPLMYVGSGVYNAWGESPRMFIISLIDGEILYEAGPYDLISHREWPAFDSSPIVNAAADTLIWPGENGVFYTIKLNTDFNTTTGELKIDPQQVGKMSYMNDRNTTYTYWLGMECSVVCFDHYAYFSENGGMFFCVDLNTMAIVWAQDTWDDSNSTPVFEFDETTGRGYLYTAPSLHWTRDGDSGVIPIFKLDAITGEIIWQTEYNCMTITDISGGVQSTPAIGRVGSNLEGMIFYTIARYESFYGGLMVALDTETGEEVWRWEMDDYTWSSPVGVYNEDGRGYMVVFDSVGDGYLIDGTNGEIMDTCDVDWLVEASPVAFEDKIVVGTRGSEIYCIDLE